jgi:5-methylthioadenosine/S-adenosylhomocysteine deaminase
MAVRMATLGGARTLGLQESIGSLEIGKRADLIVVEAAGPHVVPTANPFSTLVYGCRAADVRHVLVDGRVLVRDRGLLTLERERALSEARRHARRLFDRM